jgi:hypothetical protein
MPGVAEELEFVAMESVALVRQQMQERDGGGDGQKAERRGLD